MSYRTIAVETRGAIEILSLARPEVLNAIFPEMALEDRQQVMLSATKDHQEAMTAFAEKRSPQYRGQ